MRKRSMNTHAREQKTHFRHSSRAQWLFMASFINFCAIGLYTAVFYATTHIYGHRLAEIETCAPPTRGK